MRLMNRFMKMFQGRNDKQMFRQLFQGRKGIGAWILVLISGLGTLVAFQMNRKGNGKRENTGTPGRTIHRPQTRSARRMDYAWAAEMADEFLKNNVKKPNQ